MEPTTQISVRARRRKRARASGVVVPHAPRWYQRLAGWLIWALIRGVSATLRSRWEDRSGFFDGSSSRQAIFCVWHNRLGLCMTVYDELSKRFGPMPPLAALVSASKDGGFLASVLEKFRVQPVRGSSSRRGAQALLELTTWAERGYALALTPDGPRGPRYVVQEGITSLAQVTGLPIAPISYRLKWKIVVKSWDRFQVPLPFMSYDVILGPMIRIPREATDAEREMLRQNLQATLREISGD